MSSAVIGTKNRNPNSPSLTHVTSQRRMSSNLLIFKFSGVSFSGVYDDLTLTPVAETSETEHSQLWLWSSKTTAPNSVLRLGVSRLFSASFMVFNYYPAKLLFFLNLTRKLQLKHAFYYFKFLPRICNPNGGKPKKTMVN